MQALFTRVNPDIQVVHVVAVQIAQFAKTALHDAHDVGFVLVSKRKPTLHVSHEPTVVQSAQSGAQFPQPGEPELGALPGAQLKH